MENMEAAAMSDAEFDLLFQGHWVLKEVFLKARGNGAAFGLMYAEFDFEADLWNGQLHLRINGV